MPISIVGLRKWLALMAGGFIVIVVLFYLYAQRRAEQVPHEVPAPLPYQVQQSTQDFELSKSEHGRTLFTVRAARTVQFKQGGRASLRDVNIIIYGKESNRFDQIYGKNFEYDPKTGEIAGIGPVHIDLEGNAQGPTHPDQTPPEVLQNPIHIDTTDLVFNEKTGNAATHGVVNFKMAQASGSAVGARYIAKENTLVIDSNVDITVLGANPSHILAAHAAVTKVPRQVVLDKAVLIQEKEKIAADVATILFKPDNTAYRIIGNGNVQGQTSTGIKARAERADYLLNPHNTFHSGVLTGNVHVEQAGTKPMQGTAQQVSMEFAADNQLSKMRAVKDVKLLQSQVPVPGQVQQAELDSDAVDFRFKPGQQLDHADTSGKAQIVILTSPAAPKPRSAGQPVIAKSSTASSVPIPTTLTARKFHAVFGDDNQIKFVRGAPDAKIVSQNPGQPDRVSTSRTVDASFSDEGAISKVVQTGEVHYVEGQREAWADKGTYTPSDMILTLNGSPRIVEKSMTTTADVLRMNRQSGQALANGHVKTTYSELKLQPGGAMLASSDPIHVVSTSMTADRNSNLAVYSGGARLWQGGNVVRAPAITFNRADRSMLAEGVFPQRVDTLFLQTEATGAISQTHVTANHLDYSDPQRRAHFSGGVVMRSAQGTVTADDAIAYLLPRVQGPAARESARGSDDTPSQIDHVVADGHVVVQQPGRRATGNHLVYTAAQAKYVLTGGNPSIFDAERGSVNGDSLTFYSHDDRVLVESKGTSPAITQTRPK